MDNQEIERSTRIDQYLKGRMTETEMAHFKNQLEEDATLRAELENYEISREAIRNYGLRQELKDIRSKMLAEPAAAPATKPKVVPFSAYWPRVAAAVLLLITGLLALQIATLSGEDLYEEKAFPYEVTTSRNAEEPTDTQNQTIQEYYGSGNFKETATQYKNLSDPSPAAAFVAGNAYLQLDQPQQAVDAFQNVLETNARQGTRFFQEDAEFYLAMSYLRAGNYEEALSRLRQIKAAGGDYSQYISNYYLFRLRMLDWMY